jgi:hypothetical protein
MCRPEQKLDCPTGNSLPGNHITSLDKAGLMATANRFPCKLSTCIATMRRRSDLILLTSHWGFLAFTKSTG